MIVLLVRHARAGDRSEWEGDDRLRPLDKKGRRQAKAKGQGISKRAMVQDHCAKLYHFTEDFA